MNPNSRIATGMQGAQIGFMVASELTKLFDGKLLFSQAQTAITDPNMVDIKKLAEKFSNEIFAIPIDPWVDEMRKISHFYKTCFSDEKWKNPDWEHVSIPETMENLKRPEFIFGQMTEDEAFEAYAERCGLDWIKKSNLYKSINKAIKEQQTRPAGDYAMRHVGGRKPDMLNKNYNDGILEDIIFMTPKEGIISAFRYTFETRKIYDGFTIFSALDYKGNVMRMNKFGSSDKFIIGEEDRSRSLFYYGLRQVGF